jgi:hypothetical protein
MGRPSESSARKDQPMMGTVFPFDELPPESGSIVRIVVVVTIVLTVAGCGESKSTATPLPATATQVAVADNHSSLPPTALSALPTVPSVAPTAEPRATPTEISLVPSAAPTTRPGYFSRDALIADARQLADILESAHPNPYINGGGKIAFHRRLQLLLNTIPAEGMTREESIRLLRPFIAAVGDAHTELWSDYPVNTDAPGGVPLRFGVVEESLYVAGVPDEESRDIIGATLVSVEGVPLAELRERDIGYQTKFVMVPDAGVAVIVLSNYSGPDDAVTEVTRLALGFALGSER